MFHFSSPLLPKLRLVSFTAALATLPATAQTRTWTTVSPDGTSCLWSDAAKWSDGEVPDTAEENATFPAYDSNRTIDLNNNYGIGFLTIVPRTASFVGRTFALTGSTTLTLQNGLSISGGTSVSVAPGLVIAADQTWTTLNETGVAPLVLNGIVSGPGKITRAANAANNTAGLITFAAANTFSGGFQQNAFLNNTRLGSSTVVTGGVIESGPLGTGPLFLNSGALSSNNATARTLHHPITVTGIITLGNTGANGALTLTDSGLSTPSLFTLGSPNNQANLIVRAAGTNVTFEQSIVESGGTGQSLQLASAAGVPTITLARPNSFTGGLLSSGINLILANGATHPGPLTAVGGSVTAQSGSGFSTGLLLSDGAALNADDPSAWSAVTAGNATVLNQGRISFTVEQTQAVLAGLISPLSEVRIGLGTGAGGGTYFENYQQAALGAGRAGLVSGGTGMATYTGILTPGADGNFRLGGGAGTLALPNAGTLTGAAGLIVEGGGVLSLAQAQDYTGPTLVQSALTLQGPAASLPGTSGVTVRNSVLTFDNAAGDASAADRLADTVPLVLQRGVLSFINNGTAAPPAEIAGPLTFQAGANAINLANTPVGTKSFTVSSLTRLNQAVAVFRGDSFGPLAEISLGRNLFKITGTAPVLTGGGGAEGQNDISILPWARGGTSGGASTAGANTFTTFDTTLQAMRHLRPAVDYVQANNNTTARIDEAINNAGGDNDYNVRSIPNTAGGSSLVAVPSSNLQLNALLFDNASSTGANTYGLNASTLNIASGAVHLQHTTTQNITLNNGTLAFGSAEGVITTNANGFFLTSLATQITGTGGLSLYALNGGGITLGNITNAGFSGGLTIGGNGFIAVDQDQRFGDPSNGITHAGGELRFFAGFPTSRPLVLLGGTGDNTLANNSTFLHTWNGPISGEGRLRLINNSSATSATGFTLTSANTYTGGTLIEGISVTGTNDESFGTGPVTLQGGTNNAATLTLTSATPQLGGLRGPDGRVILNPAGPASTLTLGAANQSGVFSGVIAQGTGKTGSLLKTGSGALFLAGRSGYTGFTSVQQGTLGILVPWLDDNSTVDVNTSAVLHLAHTFTDVVADFQIDGISQGPGLFGAPGSGAPRTTPRLSGTGRLLVPGGADPFQDWIANFPSLTGANTGRTADPDKDGLDNLTEFAVDGNPTRGTADGKSRTAVETIGGSPALVLTLPVRDGAVFDSVPGPGLDATVDGVTYLLAASRDLTVFDQPVLEIPVTAAGLPALSPGWSYRAFRPATTIGSTQPRGFLRAKITPAP